MTKKGIHRVEIKPEILRALRVECVVRGMKEKELVNLLILRGLGEKAKEFLGEKEKCGGSANIENPPKRTHRDNKPLEDFPDLRAQVDKLLDEKEISGMSYQEIGDVVGRSRFCIKDYEKRRSKAREE